MLDDCEHDERATTMSPAPEESGPPTDREIRRAANLIIVLLAPSQFEDDDHRRLVEVARWLIDNARTVAAAGELLEAARRVLDRCHTNVGSYMPSDYERSFDSLAAAIDHAT